MSAHDLDALCQTIILAQAPLIFSLALVNFPSLYTHTHTGPGGVLGGGVPAGLGVRLAERGGGAPAAGGCRAGEEEGETGRASQANPGRGGEAG